MGWSVGYAGLPVQDSCHLGEYVFSTLYWPVYLVGVGVGHIVGRTAAASLPAGQEAP
jgi:hypothetical protein